MVLGPYTGERRDILENPSPEPWEIAQGRSLRHSQGMRQKNTRKENLLLDICWSFWGIVSNNCPWFSSFFYGPPRWLSLASIVKMSTFCPVLRVRPFLDPGCPLSKTISNNLRKTTTTGFDPHYIGRLTIEEEWQHQEANDNKNAEVGLRDG